MNNLAIIGFALLGWWIGMFLVMNYIKRGMDKMEKKPVKKACPPHTWEELESYPGSELYYLKCKDCNKTLDQIFNG